LARDIPRCCSRKETTMKARTSRIAVALLGAVMIAMVGGGQAMAVPSNDDVSSPTPITSLPFSDGPTDTRDATTGEGDPDCVGNGPTVWYELTLPETTGVELNTIGSDYDTTLSVYTGAPGSLEQVACNDDYYGLQSRVVIEATAGTTYLVMAGAFASGSGGTLFIQGDVAQPPFTLGASVTGGTVKASTGVGTIGGTIGCNSDGWFALYGTLQQRIGRSTLSSGFEASGDCTAPSTTWSAPFQSYSGLFVPGKVTVSNVYAYGCNDTGCDDVFIEGPIEVRLRGQN
jgi:hypothetical protein